MAEMTDQKKKTAGIVGIAAGIAAAVLIAVLVVGLGRAVQNPGPETEQPAEAETLPQVHSAEDAISFLESKGEDLGYDNALSELTELRSVTVSGDSYYRLQQNYRGIPVYGRTVVYAADEQGNQLTVTQNIQDVPGGLNLEPTVRLSDMQYYLLAYLAETDPEGIWAEALANEDVSVLPEITRDPEALCIYTLDGSAHLAYELHLDGLCVLFDAHTGQVLHSYPTTVYEEATFHTTGEKINAGRMDDGTYVLKDEDTGTYVYTANSNTYCIPNGGYDRGQLILVTSEDSVFGSGIDSVDRVSMETARLALERVNHIRGFFNDLDAGDGSIVGRLLLVYDDLIGSENGENAYANCGTTVAFTGAPLYDESFFKLKEWVGLVGFGTVYSADPLQYADIFAHEYTHVVSRILVNWVSYSGENGALNEAYSDIMSELYEAQLKQGQPDWLHGVLMNNGQLVYVTRNLQAPGDTTTYPIRDNRTYPAAVSEYNGTDPHIGSTIVSHIAYRLAAGDPANPDTVISCEDQAVLWFKSMLLLNADADFLDCRAAVLSAAAQMGLSEAQTDWIGRCFDDAGIVPVDPDVDFLVQEVFTTDILDADGQRCTDCDVIVRRGIPSRGSGLSTDAPIVWHSGESERCHLRLEPGFYTMTVRVHGEPEAEEIFEIQVMDDASAPEEISIHMNQGKSMVDVAVMCSADGGEVPLAGALIEIYRDNPNELVYLGKMGEDSAGLRIYLDPDKYTIIATARGYAPAQVTIDMADTSSRYSHSFLMEPSGEELIAGLPGAPEEITGGAPYEVVTWERSHSGQTDGVNWSNRYVYDYIVLLGDDPAYEVINRDLYQFADAAMGWIREEDLHEPQYDHEGICENYEVHTTTRVLHNGNGIICILISPNQAVTYSLYNGARLGLYTLAGDYGEAYLQGIRSSFYDPSKLVDWNLGDFNFAVMDGEIVLLNYSSIIRTGLYVSTEYTDRLKGTMRAPGGTGPAGYEIHILDRSFRRLGAPACLQEMRALCEYPVFSGAPACGQINQEVSSLAEQFMASFPNDYTQTSNRFEFSWECNEYCENENVSYQYHDYAGVMYNDNGILSYVMNWRIVLCHYKNGQSPTGAERYYGLHGIVYDQNTGAHLTLPQITGMDEQTQLLMLKDAYARVYNNYFFTTKNVAYDPSVLSLTDPDFIVDKYGQIVLHFSVEEEYSEEYLEDLPRMVHIYTITLPTGLYILAP